MYLRGVKSFVSKDPPGCVITWYHGQNDPECADENGERSRFDSVLRSTMQFVVVCPHPERLGSWPPGSGSCKELDSG